MMGYIIYQGISWFIRLLQLILIARACLSWFVRPDNGLYRLLCMFSEPLVEPFRRLINRFMRRPMMFDMGTLLAYVALMILQQIINLAFMYL